MQVTAPTAGRVRVPRTLPHGTLLTVPTALASYNISLNFSSFLALLPGTRFLARWRRKVHNLDIDDVGRIVDDWAMEAATLEPDPSAAQPAPEQPLPFPGPWGFFTSRYMLGLFIMAVLLHRMQNIVIPSRYHSRRPRAFTRFQQNSRSTFYRALVLDRLYSSILPLDFSKTSTRLALHLPSLYFICKMLLMWTLLVLQTCNLLPAAGQGPILTHITRLAQWCDQKTMSEISWSTFCAVCAAFLVEGFVKTLDGIGSGFPIGNANPNTSPFNLVGYAFLLHVYSSPVAHAFHPEGNLPSRPDKHVVITIAIPLLQLTIFHTLSVSKRLSSHRLLPTALTSFLSLVHFHGTLLSHFFQPTDPASSQPATKAPTRRMYMGATTYPLLNYIPNIFETILICTILLTVSLNVIVRLLVRGRVDRVFSGLGIGTHLSDDDSNGFWASLPWDEDFGVLLLRVGTASLEATSLRGWNNEVAPLRLPVAPHTFSNFGTVRLGRQGVGEVATGFSLLQPAGRSRRSIAGRSQRGFTNEVRNVDVGITEGSISNANGRDSWARWLKELKPFSMALWGAMKGLFIFLVKTAKGTRLRSSAPSQGRRKTPAPWNIGRPSVPRRGRDRDVYARFLDGEDISDDETDDWAAGGEDVDDSDEAYGVGSYGIRDPSSGSVSESGEEDSEEDEGTEAVQLLADFMRPRDGQSGNGELVLAHLAHSEGSPRTGPLTRRRWANLASGLRNQTLQGGEDEDDLVWGLGDVDVNVSATSSACVICTTENRDIVCWPCRCLAICDNCREAMSTKSAPTKHRCPCCRQTVEGYSRIYVP